MQELQLKGCRVSDLVKQVVCQASLPDGTNIKLANLGCEFFVKLKLLIVCFVVLNPNKMIDELCALLVTVSCT